MFYNPFVGNSRMNFMQPQNQFTQPQQQQYDFSGWGDRLTKIEEGIAGLTNQFNNFQTPGDVAPEYTGNAAPEPFPILPDINTIARPGPIMGEVSQKQVGGPGGINTLQPGGQMPEGSNEMFGQRPGIIDPNIGPVRPPIPGNQFDTPRVGGPGIISPMEPPGGPGVPIGGPGIIDPNFSPYQRNENLDLTNRANIMQEYGNYLKGGMGSRAHTADMQGGYSFMGEDMAPGSGTGFGDFRKFLGTFGIGDRLQYDQGQMLQAAPQQTGIASLAQNNQGPGI